jgi:hypothetical protein
VVFLEVSEELQLIFSLAQRCTHLEALLDVLLEPLDEDQRGNELCGIEQLSHGGKIKDSAHLFDEDEGHKKLDEVEHVCIAEAIYNIESAEDLVEVGVDFGGQQIMLLLHYNIVHIVLYRVSKGCELLLEFKALLKSSPSLAQDRHHSVI